MRQPMRIDMEPAEAGVATMPDGSVAIALKLPGMAEHLLLPVDAADTLALHLFELSEKAREIHAQRVRAFRQ